MAAACPPVIPTPARPTASAAIPSTPQTPTTPPTANAAAGPACGRRNPSEPWKEVARMRPERLESPKPHGSESAVDNLLFVAVGAVSAATMLVWVVAEVAGVPFHLAKHPGDPRLAWPRSVRGMLPGPVGMYTTLVLVLSLPAALGSAVLGRRFRWDRRLQKQGAQWATRWRLRRLLVLSPRPGRITLGRRGGWWGRLLLAVESCHSVLCFGPAGSFKTAGLVIPAVLEWSGPVITTSIKPDVLRATLRRRLALGEVWVLRPPGPVRRPGRAVDPAGALRRLHPSA